MARISLWRVLSLAAVILLVFTQVILTVSADDVTIETEESTYETEFKDESEDESPTVRVVSPVTPSNSNGFKRICIALFGNYDPVIVEYNYTNSNGYTSTLREVEPDYAWMISVAIFAIVVFCVFRFVGGLFKRG